MPIFQSHHLIGNSSTRSRTPQRRKCFTDDLSHRPSATTFITFIFQSADQCRSVSIIVSCSSLHMSSRRSRTPQTEVDLGTHDRSADQRRWSMELLKSVVQALSATSTTRPDALLDPQPLSPTRIPAVVPRRLLVSSLMSYRKKTSALCCIDQKRRSADLASC